MHLGLGVPSIWYRAQFQIGSGPGMLRAAGVTLPGLPALVVGSNGTVAWGFTNAYGKWFDWVDVPENAAIKTHQEPIEVKGGATQTLVVVEMDGAPVITTEGQRRYALHWVAHEGAAYNLELDRMLQTPSDKATLVLMTDQAFRTSDASRAVEHLTHILDVQVCLIFSQLLQTFPNSSKICNLLHAF